MHRRRNAIGSRLMATHDEVLLNYMETMAQAVNDFGRRSDQGFDQNALGLGIDCS